MACIIDEFEAITYRSRGIFVRKHSRKIDNKTVLRWAIFVLNQGVSWKSLEDCMIDVHYQSIYKRFIQWARHGILEHAWTIYLQQYVSERLSLSVTAFQNLYVDTTMIKNVAGIDVVGGNPTDRARKATKVSVIIDINKIAISRPVAFPANRSDIKTLIPTIDSIPFPLRTDNRRTLKLSGDKAYRAKEIARWLHHDKKIRIIAEPKSNEMNPTPIGKGDIAMHKKRIYVEHFFGMMKRLKRIRNRFDKHVFIYTTFWYLAMARATFRKLQAFMTGDPYRQP